MKNAKKRKRDEISKPDEVQEATKITEEMASELIKKAEIWEDNSNCC